MTLAADLLDNIAEVLDDPDIGRPLWLRRGAPGTYDPATGGSTGDDAGPAIPFRGLILGYRDRDIDGSRILARDRKVIFKLKGIAIPGGLPLQGDYVLTSATPGAGEVYAVVGSKTVELGGHAVHCAAQVRTYGADDKAS